MIGAAKKLLRVFTDEAAYFGDRKLFEHIAALAREQNLAGVTVLEALIGFGQSAQLHRSHVLERDRSVVIEIVDDEDKLRGFAGALGSIPEIGLITLQDAEVIGGRAQNPHGTADNREGAS